MIETLTVTIAPRREVALIRMPSGELYSLQKGEEVRIEKAPQMFNLQLDKSRYTVEMEDEHPFHKVRYELEAAAAKSSLVTILLTTMDVDFSDETRQSCAERASTIVADYPESLVFARKTMLEVPLPAEFEVKGEIVATLSQPLQDLIREVVAKWRP